MSLGYVALLAAGAVTVFFDRLIGIRTGTMAVAKPWAT